MTRFQTILGAGVLTLGVAFAAFAAPTLAQERGEGRGHGPRHDDGCRAEVQQLCPDADSHEERRACVQERRAELSDTCQEKLSQREEKRAAIQAACHQDAAEICPGLEPGRELMQCMHENKDAVSQTCKDAIQAAHPHKGKGHRKGRGKGRAERSGDAP